MKLLILDGNSIMNRAFFGVRLLSTRGGEYTNALFGFLNILQRLTEDEKPDALCVAFDRKAPTFRHLRYEGYKATRHPMPAELVPQMVTIKEILSAMRVPVYELDGWEADDILGTAARLCTEKDWQCVIATGDRDSLQLVSDRVTVRLAVSRSGQTVYAPYTPEVFREEYGFEPPIMVDLKALMGDSSDNIPGVAGVGPKTAKELLWKYASLDGVYAALDAGDEAIRGSVRTKLTQSRDMAYLSYELATIRTDAPVELSPEAAMCQPPDEAALYALFLRLEFTKMIERYRLHPQAAEKKPETQAAAVRELTQADAALRVPDGLKKAAVCFDPAMTELAVSDGETVYRLTGDALCGETLGRLFSGKTELVTAQSKELRRALWPWRIQPQGIVFDASAAAYVLDATQSDYGAARLALRYLNCEADTVAAQAAALFRMEPILTKQLEEAGLSRYYFETELPLCAVLADMEREGITVDRAELARFGELLAEKMARAESEIYRYAGGEFNIQSTKQLGEVLFERLGLPARKKTKTGYSTDAESLAKLEKQHPIVAEISEYRALAKLRSTYAEGLLKQVGDDGRIHTTFQNTVTATGRLSSTEPNLQNIPVRTEMGGEIRKMFLPRQGWRLVDADYSQIELRVLAHIAEDTAMQQAFLSGADFHTATAAQIFGVPTDAVTPEMRRNAKAVNFGVVYGISGFSLAEDLGVSRAEAQAFIQAYFARFSGVARYRERVIADAHRDGCVTTLLGRRREIPELKNSNHMIRAAGERIALNSPIQGTAAEIMKIAMVRTAAALKREGLQARLLLQVHDELIAECPPEEVAQVKAILQREMQGAAALAVPLLTEAHDGANWLEAK